MVKMNVVCGVKISESELRDLFSISHDAKNMYDLVEDKCYQLNGKILKNEKYTLYPGMDVWFDENDIYIGYYVLWNGHYSSGYLYPVDIEEALSKPNNEGARIFIYTD